MKKRSGWLAPLVWVALVACGESEASNASTLQTAVVTRQDLRLTAEATGSVEPIRTVEVKSKASGEILRLHVETGDRVEPGALLAEVDPRDVRNGYNQAMADLEVAEARVEIAQAQLQRSQELLDAGVITRQEHEGKNLEFANARAALVKAETNLELASLRLDDVTIRAPLAGTIIAKNVEEGQVIQSASSNVSGGTTLLLMANLDEMQVRTLVDETDVGQIRAGMPASVEVEAFPGQTFRGTVDKVEPQAVVQQNVTMFPVIVNLDNRAGLLKPGMNAEVEVLIDERSNVLVLPNNALVNPREMAPAAMVLGLDPEQIQMDRGAFVGRGGPGSPQTDTSPEAAAGGGRQADATTSPGEARSRADRMAALDPERRARFDSLRAQVASGEISQDSMRALMAELRSREGRAGGSGGAGGLADAASPTEDRWTPRGPSVEPRAAVAFVVDADGTIEPRMLRIGINDWDNTEVVSGLEEGEVVALIGAAQLQAQQQEWVNRIRERVGGPIPGAGGPRR